jgi:hypothetical protein
MDNSREWVVKKLANAGLSTTKIGTKGLIIHRVHLPDARVYCVGVDQLETFGAEDLDASMRDMPDLQFVVVLPTDPIAHDAYEHAEELGICVAGFGELKAALDDDHDVARHVDTQERYERRRILGHPSVESLKRRGHHAYEIRRSGLRPLTIVTTNFYEFTADELYSLQESFAYVELDMIVVTNPNCQGFSTDSLTAAEQTGIELVRLREFLAYLGKKWK